MTPEEFKETTNDICTQKFIADECDEDYIVLDGWV